MRMSQISPFPKSWVRRKLGEPKAREGWSNKLAVWKAAHLNLGHLSANSEQSTSVMPGGHLVLSESRERLTEQTATVGEEKASTQLQVRCDESAVSCPCRPGSTFCSLKCLPVTSSSCPLSRQTVGDVYVSWVQCDLASHLYQEVDLIATIVVEKKKI